MTCNPLRQCYSRDMSNAALLIEALTSEAEVLDQLAPERADSRWDGTETASWCTEHRFDYGTKDAKGRAQGVQVSITFHADRAVSTRPGLAAAPFTVFYTGLRDGRTFGGPRGLYSYTTRDGAELGAAKYLLKAARNARRKAA